MRSGFAEKTHFYRRNAKNWIREHCGIYRLADFPARSARTLCFGISGTNQQEAPEGTYSHDTALSFHELSDIMASNCK